MVLRRTSCYQLLSTFFGLTSEHRKAVFDQIHEIVFHGNGGYTFTDVYGLPIHIRKYVFHKLKEHYDKVNKTQDSAEEFTDKVKSNQIQVPDYAKGAKLKYNGGAS